MNKPTSDGPMVLFAGNSHPELAHLISDKLGTPLGAANIFYKSNREVTVDLDESVRGKEVYILQTGSKDINNDVIEMLIMAYACKTSSSKRVIGVLPYLPYSKQSKMRKRGSIVSRLMASMICKAGFNHIITMDLHQKEIQGFFNCPVDNLRGSPFLIKYIIEKIPDYRNAVMVARHPEAVKRATSYAERLRLGIAVIHGEEKSESERDDGRNSPPPESSHLNTKAAFELIPRLKAKEKPPIHIVGDVGGKIAIVVDDIIDDVEAFVSAAQILHERGAYKIYVLATHGVLSADAPRLIEDSLIDEVVVTNTVPHDVQKMQCHKIKTVDISALLVESIRRIHNKESMSHLFQDVCLED